jgi:hypothetical protein
VRPATGPPSLAASARISRTRPSTESGDASPFGGTPDRDGRPARGPPRRGTRRSGRGPGPRPGSSQCEPRKSRFGGPSRSTHAIDLSADGRRGGKPTWTARRPRPAPTFFLANALDDEVEECIRVVVLRDLGPRLVRGFGDCEPEISRHRRVCPKKASGGSLVAINDSETRDDVASKRPRVSTGPRPSGLHRAPHFQGGGNIARRAEPAGHPLHYAHGPPRCRRDKHSPEMQSRRSRAGRSSHPPPSTGPGTQPYWRRFAGPGSSSRPRGREDQTGLQSRIERYGTPAPALAVAYENARQTIDARVEDAENN